jgi:hypothetical protein
MTQTFYTSFLYAVGCVKGCGRNIMPKSCDLYSVDVLKVKVKFLSALIEVLGLSDQMACKWYSQLEGRIESLDALAFYLYPLALFIFLISLYLLARKFGKLI